MPLNVLIIGLFSPPINGCSHANDTLLKNLVSRGISVRHINTSAGNLSGSQGSFSIFKALWFIRMYAQIGGLVRSDVVYMTPGQTLFGLIKYAPFMVLCMLLRTPYIIHVHGNHLGTHFQGLSGLRKSVFRFFVSRAAAGIVLSESLRNNFSGLLAPARVFVVENFAEHSLFPTSPLMKDYGKLRVLYLSNLMREKGILDLLDALLLLKRRGVGFEATIAGQMEDGIGAEVRARLDELGACVRYVGSVTGLTKLDSLMRANVMVLPTYYVMEGQPISLLEGLATGNIIVATAHAGIPDVISESHGYMVPLRDPGTLAEVLLSISKELPAQVLKFAVSNSNYAAGRFTEREFTDRIVHVLGLVVEADWSRLEADEVNI